MPTIDNTYIPYEVLSDLQEPSKQETQALVALMLFLGMGFPLICMLVAFVQCWQLKRHRRHVMAVRHYVQRMQLEEEMAERAERGLNFIQRAPS